MLLWSMYEKIGKNATRNKLKLFLLIIIKSDLNLYQILNITNVPQFDIVRNLK